MNFLRNITSGMRLTIGQTTQYLKFNFSQAGSYDTIIAEVAVIGQDNQQIPIQSINNLAGDNPDLQNLVDEQSMVQYPVRLHVKHVLRRDILRSDSRTILAQLQIPYEWTHPPLGKLIQAAGIAIFGFDPFGWRIMGVIFATLMIVLSTCWGKSCWAHGLAVSRRRS